MNSFELLRTELVRELKTLRAHRLYALTAYLIAIVAGPAFVLLFEPTANWHLKGLVGMAVCWSLFVSMYFSELLKATCRLKAHHHL